MTQKGKQIAELVCVLAAILLIVVLFVMLSPSVFSSSVALPLKMLYECSPFILMAALVTVVTVMNKRSLSLGLGLKIKSFPRQLVMSLVIFAITITLVVALPLLFGMNKRDVLSSKASSTMILIYRVIKAILFVGIGEELVWRGYFYERLKDLTNSGFLTVLLSSLFFGLWHYPNGQNILQVIVVSGLGLIYGFARLKVRDCSTLATGIGHGLHDATIVILSYFLL